MSDEYSKAFRQAFRDPYAVNDELRARIARLERVLRAVDARMRVGAWDFSLGYVQLSDKDFYQIRRVIAAALGEGK